MEHEKKIIVTIQCITYNHEPFIRQCLEGFVMQKTNFPFEAIVHDDASTDGTASIILEYAQKYPDIIRPIIETENQYSKHDGSLGKIMNKHTYGKYVAICEGDDYWTDPYKLQKQVDFLESHPDYGMVHTKASEYVQKRHVLSYGILGYDYTSFDDLLKQNCISTLTTCYRKKILDNYYKEVHIDSGWMLGDFPLWLYMAWKTKVKLLDDVTGVYRVLEKSAFHTNDFQKQVNFQLSVFSIQKYYMDMCHREYLHKDIAQRSFSEIVNIHNKYHKRLNFKEYKDKLNICSLGFIFELKCFLRLLKHFNFCRL